MCSSDLPAEHFGEATGVTQTVRNLGAALGLAVLGTVLSTAVRHRIEDSLAGFGVPATKADAIASALHGSSNGAATKALTDLDKQLWDVEMQLVSRSEIHSDDKYFPEAYKVYMNLIWLSGAVGQGASDEAGGVDWKPTDVQYQVTTMIEGQITKAKSELEKIKASLPAWNTANAAKGISIK